MSSKQSVAKSAFMIKIKKSLTTGLQQKEPNQPEWIGTKTVMSVPLSDCGCLKHSKNSLPALKENGKLS